MIMRFFSTLLAVLALAGAAFADEPVTLRDNIVVSGPAITLGDVFEGAGDASERAVALSPAPGASQAYRPAYFADAARAAGLEWSAPSGMTQIIITRAEATRSRPTAGGVMRPGVDAGEDVIRRGEMISLSYTAPGVQLTMRARALENGAVGETIRLLNVESNREVEAVVTGAGAAALSS